MTTRALAAFGTTFQLEESVVENGFVLLDKLREEKTAPMNSIQAVARELSLTSGAATALFAEWMSTRKPIF